MNYDYYPIKRATINSAGYDFCVPESMTLHPGEWYKINTGVRFDGTEKLPMPRQGKIGGILDKILGMHYCDKWCMKLYPRSSMGMKYGLRFSNTTGIIDSDYRGNIMIEVSVDKVCFLEKGERIAQGILTPYFVFEDEEEPVKTRNGGMGSTGKQ